ncbi:solute carrier family 44 member 3 [Willisornis vidua]|uniref:Choline transporter-like protein n=1 Tax=Willisornis vidua TaxID=1566151 RepID=A0ABQ9CSS4_9PASS|nr:solute carrier family 44 member 3 [Willisornis vidua]
MTNKNKSFLLFNRCVPRNPECYSKYASVLISMVNEMDVFHRILSGILAGRDTVIGLSVLALVVSGVLWWLHYDYRNDPSTELETEKENVKFLLGYAIFSTIVTVVLLFLIFVLRKRLRFTVQLFRIVGTAQSTSGGQVEYRALSGICYMAWYHFIGLIWTSEFILACQQMVIAGAVVTCYFNRFFLAIFPLQKTDIAQKLNPMEVINLAAFLWTKVCIQMKLVEKLELFKNKNSPPPHPVLSSISVLFCYHLGTAVKGSFLITILRIPRIVLLYLHNILKQKVFVVCFTVFGGLMAFNYHRELQAWVVPLLLVGFFAYLMSHSFLSVFEVTADAMFLCFAIDMETNDGTAEKPYFVDQELLVNPGDNSKDI